MLTIKALLKKIVEYNDLPKFQVERAISPMLSFYIEDILSKTYGSDKLELISPEYPLKNKNNQSTNIDYLLINKTKSSVLLVELKTNFRASTSSVLEHQKKYEAVLEKIASAKAGFLVEDIEKIISGTEEKEKYKYLIKRANKINKEICKGEIVYLVPKTVKDKILNDINKKILELKQTNILSFDEIPKTLPNDVNYSELVKALLLLK